MTAERRPPSIHAARAWKDGVVVTTGVDPLKLREYMDQPGELVWIDLVNPAESDLSAILTRAGLPQNAVEDLLGPLERPKIVQHEDWTYFTVYATRHNSEHEFGQAGVPLTRQRISAVVNGTTLLTVRLDDTFDMSLVVQRWDEGADVKAHGMAALVHGLLDVVVDGHFDTIQQLDDVAESLEDELFNDKPPNQQFIRKVYSLRKELSELRRVIVPMREIMQGLQRRTRSQDPDMEAWWIDLNDHVLRAIEWTESVRDMASSLIETDMSMQDWRLNTDMKKLAGWAGVIAVPTLITGWFGQNVEFPGNGEWTGLLISTLIIVGSSLALYLQFKRRDWL